MANKKFLEYAEELMDFFEESYGMNLTPRPSIVLDKTPNSRLDPFIPTGHYNPITETITLHISNRHAKDILRTLAHELVHHFQNLRDHENFMSFQKSGNLEDNPKLAEYETEAYAKGNVIFRSWTETYTH